MDDEHGEHAGAGRPAEAIQDPMAPEGGERRTGLLSAVDVAPLCGDPEQYWEGLFVQLEAEASQVQANERRSPQG